MLLSPHNPRGFAEGFHTVPSHAALKCLTQLTSLQLQACFLTDKCMHRRQLLTFISFLILKVLHECLPAARLARVQVAGIEPENGSIQPSITRLWRLARLHVIGTLECNVVELPPGFGTLSALTFLNFSLVSRHSRPRLFLAWRTLKQLSTTLTHSAAT